MSESPKQSADRNDDASFAKDLEDRHENLMARKLDSKASDPRLESAVKVLELLEQLHPNGRDNEFKQETQQDQQTVADKAPGSPAFTDDSFSAHTAILKRLGRFELIEQIGRGGFGVVFKAHDPQLGRIVAIKIPRLETALSADSLERFDREARAAASLNHPGIVGIFETGEIDGVHFIVSEFVEGDDLSSELAKGKTFSHAETANMIARLADAIEHAHQKGILHRDLKPSNVLLKRDESSWQPMITDFGLAAISNEQDITRTGAVVGTPSYMSPEQVAGKRTHESPTIDVYGLGAIFYQMLTGRPPFAGLELLETLNAIKTRDPDSIRKWQRDVPLDLEAICLKCLEKSPARRYTMARELQADLQRFVNGQPVVARRISKSEKTIRWMRRNPLVSAIGSTALVFLVAALVASIWGWTSTSRALDRESQANLETRKTINRYYIDVAENDLLDVPGLLPLRKQLLLNALDYYERVRSDSSNRSEVLEDLEIAQFRIGEIHSDLGDHAQAIDAYTEAIQLQQKLISKGVNVAEVQSRLHQTQRELARNYQAIGELDLFATWIKKAIDGQQRLLKTEADNQELKFQLAKSLTAQENSLRSNGEFKLASAAAIDAIQLMDQLVKAEPANYRYQRQLAGVHLDHAQSQGKLGQLKDSIRSVDQAIEIFRNLIETEGSNPKNTSSLSVALAVRAQRHLARNEADPGLELIEEALNLNEFLIRLYPNVQAYHRRKLEFSRTAALGYMRKRNQKKIVQLMTDNIKAIEFLLTDDHTNSALRMELAVNQMNLGGMTAQTTENSSAAATLLERAEANFEFVLQKNPRQFEARMARAFCQLNLSAVNNQLKQHRRALEFANKSIESLTSLNKEKQNVPQVVINLPSAYQNKADSFEYLGMDEDAITAWREMLALGGPTKTKAQYRLAARLASTGQVSEATKLIGVGEGNSRDNSNALALARAQACIARAWEQSGNVESARIELMYETAVKSFGLAFSKVKPVPARLDALLELDDFQPLRSREDFQEMLKNLKSVDKKEATQVN